MKPPSSPSLLVLFPLVTMGQNQFHWDRRHTIWNVRDTESCYTHAEGSCVRPHHRTGSSEVVVVSPRVRERLTPSRKEYHQGKLTIYSSLCFFFHVGGRRQVFTMDDEDRYKVTGLESVYRCRLTFSVPFTPDQHTGPPFPLPDLCCFVVRFCISIDFMFT